MLFFYWIYSHEIIEIVHVETCRIDKTKSIIFWTNAWNNVVLRYADKKMFMWRKLLIKLFMYKKALDLYWNPNSSIEKKIDRKKEGITVVYCNYYFYAWKCKKDKRLFYNHFSELIKSSEMNKNKSNLWNCSCVCLYWSIDKQRYYSRFTY